MLEKILKERLERAQKLLPDDVDGRIVLSREVSSRCVSDPNIEYILGARNVAPAAALVTRDYAVGIVHEMDSGMFRAFEEIAELRTYRKLSELIGFLRRELRDKRLLADFVVPRPYSAFSTSDALTSAMKRFLEGAARIIPASEYVARLRGEKTPAEIEALRVAAKYAVSIAEAIPELVEDGITELQLAARITARILEYGEPSFPIIVAFGENTANPHHRPSARRLRRGDPILVDFGVRRNSMCTDTTRMYHRGVPGEEFLIVLETVYGAKERAESVIKPGVPGKAVHESAVEYLKERGYDQYFVHSLGHPLGLETHDVGPALSPREERPLAAGNVVTVEPGVYMKGKFGVRLEDDVLVTPEGAKNIIRVPKEAIVVRFFSKNRGGSLFSSASSSSKRNFLSR